MYPAPANGRVTSVASTTSATTLLASSKRDTASISYDGAATLYVLIGAGTPSSTNYTIKMGSGFFTYYEAPHSYRGPIQGIWSAAVGSALVTEYC